MKATYRIENTPDNLIQKGFEKHYVWFLLDGHCDFEYERRAKCFYRTLKEAEAAGKRYLKKMKKNGFEV